MATLFLARRRGISGFERYLAIKIVHPHMAQDEKFSQMLTDEALISSRIQHPNVVHVEEFGEVADTKYMMMEFVHGCALSQLMDTLWRGKRRMSPPLAAYIAMEVAGGLHAAHGTVMPDGARLNIVHRDVSPQNILLAYQGHVKLIDFGIAKATTQSFETRTGAIKGKLSYMSPEQAWAEEVDRRSDIYALGIVTWEMLTGRKLFAGNDTMVLESVRNPQIVPPATVSSRTPKELSDVVMKALAQEVEDRFQTALEFRRALAQAVPGAHELDSAALSTLLRKVMHVEIEHSRKLLLPVAKDFDVKPEFDSGNHPLTQELSAPEVANLESDESAHDVTVRASRHALKREHERKLAAIGTPGSNEGDDFDTTDEDEAGPNLQQTPPLIGIRERTVELSADSARSQTQDGVLSSRARPGQIDPAKVAPLSSPSAETPAPSFPTDFAMTEEGAAWEEAAAQNPIRTSAASARAASAGTIGDKNHADPDEEDIDSDTIQYQRDPNAPVIVADPRGQFSSSTAARNSSSTAARNAAPKSRGSNYPTDVSTDIIHHQQPGTSAIVWVLLGVITTLIVFGAALAIYLALE